MSNDKRRIINSTPQTQCYIVLHFIIHLCSKGYVYVIHIYNIHNYNGKQAFFIFIIHTIQTLQSSCTLLHDFQTFTINDSPSSIGTTRQHDTYTVPSNYTQI